jgi:hypothetical protein
MFHFSDSWEFWGALCKKFVGIDCSEGRQTKRKGLGGGRKDQKGCVGFGVLSYELLYER